MTKFAQQLLRFKEALGISEDQQAAKALGMSKAAFSDRKRRDAFPQDRVVQFATQNPAFDLDVSYILTGYRNDEQPGAREFADRFRDAGLLIDRLFEVYALPSDPALHASMTAVAAVDGVSSDHVTYLAQAITHVLRSTPRESTHHVSADRGSIAGGRDVHVGTHPGKRRK